MCLLNKEVELTFERRVLYIGGETSKLINFSQCKTNSELDFSLKEDKVSTVFKKPN